MKLLHQYEIALGNRYRMAWLEQEALESMLAEGWRVVNAYMNTAMIRNAEGRLVSTR